MYLCVSVEERVCEPGEPQCAPVEEELCGPEEEEQCQAVEKQVAGISQIPNSQILNLHC